MKASVFAMAVLLISALSFTPSYGDESPQVIPLNVTDISQQFGCGMRPPHGGTCPVSTEITVSMPGVKGCFKPEDLTVEVNQTGSAQELTIKRRRPMCQGTTFPPQSDVIQLSTGDLLQGKPIQLMNPLAPTMWARP